MPTRINRTLAQIKREAQEEANRPITPLTPREKSAARLVHAGWDNSDIARTWGVSKQSVKNLMTEVYRKTGTKSRVELALLVEDKPDYFDAPQTARLTPPKGNVSRNLGIDKKALKRLYLQSLGAPRNKREERDLVCAATRAFLSNLFAYMVYEAARIIDSKFPPPAPRTPSVNRQPRRILSKEQIRSLVDRINARVGKPQLTKNQEVTATKVGH